MMHHVPVKFCHMNCRQSMACHESMLMCMEMLGGLCTDCLHGLLRSAHHTGLVVDLFMLLKSERCCLFCVDDVFVTQEFDLQHGPLADWLAPQLSPHPQPAQPNNKQKTRKQVKAGGHSQHTCTPHREVLPMLSNVPVHMQTNMHFASSFVTCSWHARDWPSWHTRKQNTLTA